MDEASEIVLDASAVLAWLNGEPGGEQVLELLAGESPLVTISAVNLCEVITKLVRDGVSAVDAERAVEDLRDYVVVFDGDQATIAGELCRLTRQHGLALGDRACLALGLQRGATVWTTDQVWKKLKLGVSVRVLRG